MRFYLIGIFSLFFSVLFAQNSYHDIREINQANRWLRSGLAATDVTHLMIYQHGGASMNTGGGSIGYVNDLGGAGFFDLNKIDRISGDTLFLTLPILNSYDLSASQVIGIGSDKELVFLDDVTVSETFDGDKGGVLFLAANDRLIIGGELNADGAGFRGAAGTEAASECGRFTVLNGEVYPSGDWRGSPRAEGVAAISSGQEHGRAPASNGGGGGNDHNTGGGGGGNVAEGGGGGINVVNGIFNRACRGASPGRGGRGLMEADNRIYFGGGGGAGHANNTTLASGGNGGGIIVLWAPEIDFRDGAELIADGKDGPDVNGDGAGGGGAGGSILLIADVLKGSPEVSIRGGQGGSVNNQSDRCFGPGGGGAGGRLLTAAIERNEYAPDVDFSSGGTGLRLGSNECSPTDRPAGNGSNGSQQNIQLPVPFPGFSLSAQTLCSDQQLLVTNESVGAQQVSWDVTPSSNDLTINNNGFNLAIDFAAGASGTYTLLQTLTYNGLNYPGDSTTFTVYPAVSAADASINADRETVTVTVTDPAFQTIIRYDFGDGTIIDSDQTSMSHTYTSGGDYPVSVTLINDNCEKVLQSTTVSVGEFAVAQTDSKDAGGCAPFNLRLLDVSEGTYSGRRWDFPGGSPATSSELAPEVTYTEAGQYIAKLTLLNAVGADSVATVDILVRASAGAEISVTQDTSTVVFTTTGNEAATYTWDFGDGNGSVGQNQTHTYGQTGTYNVVLTAILSPCTERIEREITIDVLSSIKDLNQLGVKVFPNPTNGRVRISGPAVLTEVLDSRGRKLLPTAEQEMDLSNFPAGMYFLRIKADNNIYTVRIVRR